MTIFLKNKYYELSRRLNLKLIDTTLVIPERPIYYREDGFNVHLSKKGQYLLADYMIKNLDFLFSYNDI
jgi:hypothetical protein